MSQTNGQDARESNAVRGEATRAAILEAAAMLIGELGWGAVTTRAIAERAQVPHGAVSYHFAGRDDLLRRAAAEATSRALAIPIGVVRTAGSLGEVLEATFSWYSEGNLNEPSGGLLLETVRQASRDESLRTILAAEIADYRAALAELIAREQSAGRLRAGDPEGIAAMLAAVFDGLIIHLLADPRLRLDRVSAAIESLLENER